jgi:hypothetical protein
MIPILIGAEVVLAGAEVVLPAAPAGCEVPEVPALVPLDDFDELQATSSTAANIDAATARRLSSIRLRVAGLLVAVDIDFDMPG